MSNKFVAKNTAIKNITGKNSSIKYLQEKTTAIAIFIAIVIILLLINKCDSDTPKTSDTQTTDTTQPPVQKPDTGLHKVDKKDPIPVNDSTGFTPEAELIEGDEITIKDIPQKEDVGVTEPKEVEKKADNTPIVQTNFTRGKGNIIQWSSDLADNAKQILITIKEKESGKLWENNQDVTGQTSWLFNPKDPRASGKAMIVTLNIIPKKGTKLMGPKILEPQYFECSGE